MLVTPDFTEVQDQVEAGAYKATVKSGEIKEWPKGGQYVNWELETFGETEPKNNGRRIFHKTALSGKGAFQLQKFYRAATGQALTGGFDTEQLIGRKLEVTLADGIRDGQPTGYIEVKNVKALSL